MRVYMVECTNTDERITFLVRGLNKLDIRPEIVEKVKKYFGSIVGVKTRIKDTKIRE